MGAPPPAIARRGAESAALAQRLQGVRRDSEALIAPLQPEDLCLQGMADASPPKWHLGHTTWFFSTFVLEPHWGRLFPGAACPWQPPEPRWGYLFNSYYEAIGSRQPRPERGLLTRPPIAEVLAWRGRVDEALAALLQRLDRCDDPGLVTQLLTLLELGLQHEQQHQELLLMDLLDGFARQPLAPAYRQDGAGPEDRWRALCRRDALTPRRWLAFAGGLVEVGHPGEPAPPPTISAAPADHPAGKERTRRLAASRPGDDDPAGNAPSADNDRARRRSQDPAGPANPPCTSASARPMDSGANTHWGCERVGDGGERAAAMPSEAAWAAATDHGSPAGMSAPAGGAPCQDGARPDGGSVGFHFDNEAPRHRQWLEPFELASTLVRNEEFDAFIADGGYRRPELWMSEGWAVVGQRGWQAPRYWRGDQEFTLAGLQPRQPQAPVRHLSWFEADAFARWAGARLPSEAEWEFAACGGALPEAFGRLWQWTASPYRPYPGFRAAAGAVGEYNGKFMSSQVVLRGSCFLTPAGHARLTYRYFFPPASRWMAAGLRLAR